jgi:hypothetical protein
MVSRLSDVFNGIVVRCRNGELRLALGPDAAVELRDREGRVVSRTPAPIAGLAAMSAAVRAEWQAFVASLDRGSTFDPEETGLLSATFIDACYRHGSRAQLSAREAIG